MKKMFDGGVLLSLFLLLIGTSTFFINNVHQKKNISKLKMHHHKKIKKLKKINALEREKVFSNRLKELEIKNTKLNYYENLNRRLGDIMNHEFNKIESQARSNDLKR